MSNTAEFNPSDEGQGGPKERSGDEELGMGPNDGHDEVGNGKDCRSECGNEDGKVEFPDGKKDVDDKEGVDKPDEGTKKRKQGDDETDFEDQRKYQEGVEKIGEAWKASNFGDPDRWVLNKRHHGGGGWRVWSGGRGTARNPGVSLYCVHSCPPLAGGTPIEGVSVGLFGRWCSSGWWRGTPLLGNRGFRDGGHWEH